MEIKSDLLHTNLTIDEKVQYVKARCFISQVINGHEWNDKKLKHKLLIESENIIKTLNDKIEKGGTQ